MSASLYTTAATVATNFLNETTTNTTNWTGSAWSMTYTILASVVVTLIMLVIVCGNALVIVAIARDRHLRGLQNWFIASLALSDLLVGLLVMPLSLANELLDYWYFGKVLCEIWQATDVLLCTASILNLCLISLDRYWSITRAISYVRVRTPSMAMLMLAIVWGLSMLISLPPLVGWKRPQPVNLQRPKCLLSEDMGYVLYSTLGSFYIPLVLMIVVYVQIYIAARSRARRNLQPKSSLGKRERNLSEKVKKAATKAEKKPDPEATPSPNANHDDQMDEIFVETDAGQHETNNEKIKQTSSDQECYSARPLLAATSTGASDADNRLKSVSESEPEGLPMAIRATDSASTRRYLAQFRRKLSKTSEHVSETADARRRRIAKHRERRATIVLGIVMTTFILCWLPFFGTYLVASIFSLKIEPLVFAVFFWLGYCNSALNPLIYTIFNNEFRNAFRRIICGPKRR